MTKELREVNALRPLLILQQLDASLHPLHLSNQLSILIDGIFLDLGARHGRIAQLSLEGREKIERLLAAIGQRDPAFFLAKQQRVWGGRVRTPSLLLANQVVRTVDVHQVGNID